MTEGTKKRVLENGFVVIFVHKEQTEEEVRILRNCLVLCAIS
jgi:hypothetical protein